MVCARLLSVSLWLADQLPDAVRRLCFPVNLTLRRSTIQLANVTARRVTLPQRFHHRGLLMLGNTEQSQ